MNIETTALGAPPGPITVAQWGAMEGPPHYELVDGRLQEKPEVASWHDMLLFQLVGFLVAHIKRHGLGQLVGSTTPLEISAFSGRKPDLFLIPTDQYHGSGGTSSTASLRSWLKSCRRPRSKLTGRKSGTSTPNSASASTGSLTSPTAPSKSTSCATSPTAGGPTSWSRR